MKRIHISKFNVLEPFSVPFEEFDSASKLKPVGLWYGFNHSWMEWCESEMPHWIYDNKYEIQITSNKMLVLKNDQEIIDFNTKYSSNINFIDWSRVFQDYGGIEIPFYSYNLRCELLWYYGWDCASGCIWDSGIIKKVIK